jgi:aryl-alcohol dehydrogenase-like predicted oxidoreductase
MADVTLARRRFGKTDWQVGEIGLGGSWFYGRPEFGLQPVSYGVAVVERAFELGVNYFDTAPLYGKGRSEEVYGHALKGVDPDSYFLATKVGYFPEPFDYTRDTVRRGFEASLERLQRDHVDLVQIHESEQAGWEGVFGKGRTLDALREIRDEGMATHIGLTGSDLGLMARILREVDDFVSVITFLKYDMLVQEAKDELLPAAVDTDAAVILASPLHGGLLGSKRDHWRETGRFADLYDKQERVEAVLARHGLDSVEAGLRYLLSDANVGMILSGVASVAELETSVAAATAGPLPPEVVAEIDAA